MIKSMNIEVLPENYFDPPVREFFRLQENCFLLFSSELAVLIIPTLLVDFHGHN